MFNHMSEIIIVYSNIFVSGPSSLTYDTNIYKTKSLILLRVGCFSVASKQEVSFFSAPGKRTAPVC